MFQKADVLLVNKIDAATFFAFDLTVLKERVRKLNPNVVIFPLPSKTGEGVGPWARWLAAAVKAWKTVRD